MYPNRRYGNITIQATTGKNTEKASDETRERMRRALVARKARSDRQ